MYCNGGTLTGLFSGGGSAPQATIEARYLSCPTEKGKYLHQAIGTDPPSEAASATLNPFNFQFTECESVVDSFLSSPITLGPSIMWSSSGSSNKKPGQSVSLPLLVFPSYSCFCLVSFVDVMAIHTNYPTATGNGPSWYVRMTQHLDTITNVAN